MKVGVMLRGVDKRGGTGVYAQNLVSKLLEQGERHEWVLLYQSEDQAGTLGEFENATEVVLPAGNAIVWDQVHVPRFAKRAQLDVLFNTKFTLPLWAPSDVACVMALHGASWYVIPECYPWWDVRYIKTVMPHYCRAAAHLVSNSQCTTRDYVEIVGVPPEKISTVPLAPADHFEPVTDGERLARVRERYGLPERFVLSVVAYDPRKNVPRLLEAFAKWTDRGQTKLVLVGSGCDRYRDELPELMREVEGDVLFPGWVEQHHLPAVYSLATVFFFPSLYEEFGIPNCEAMACGTPIVTANTGAPPDIVSDAGILVDPRDTDAMAGALDRVLGDRGLREKLSQRGIERSRRYSWRRAAAETLTVLEEATGRPTRQEVP